MEQNAYRHPTGIIARNIDILFGKQDEKVSHTGHLGMDYQPDMAYCIFIRIFDESIRKE